MAPRIRTLLLIAGSLLLSACMQSLPQPSPMPLITPPGMIVYITDDSCPSVEIQSGTTVEWINDGRREHVVQSEPNNDGEKFPNSDLLNPGDVYAVTFSEPGTIHYHCSEDGSQPGLIRITDPTSPPASLTPRLGSGVAHTCLLTQQGQVRCWGQGAHPEDQIPLEELGKLFPVEGLDATSMSVGWYHTCAATQDGGVQCWGQNTNGQLGNGTLKDSPAPITVLELKDVVAVSAGASHSCAVTGAGEAYCWGANAQGQLGDGSMTDRSKPVRVEGLAGPVASIAAGSSYTCAILVSGPVQCWGDFDFIHGEERHQIQTSPTKVSHLDENIKKLAAGDHHICALTISKQVKCEGFFFPPNDQPFSKPVEVLGDMQGHIRDILAQTDFTCVATDSGKVYCWGDNYFDQIGDGTFLTAGKPKLVSRAGDEVIALGGGHYTVCALRLDGTIACWGDTSYGQLSDGTARWK